jgi:hypothetical protein
MRAFIAVSEEVHCPDDGGSIHLRNVDLLQQDYMTLSQKVVIFILAAART